MIKHQNVIPYLLASHQKPTQTKTAHNLIGVLLFHNEMNRKNEKKINFFSQNFFVTLFDMPLMN